MLLRVLLLLPCVLGDAEDACERRMGAAWVADVWMRDGSAGVVMITGAEPCHGGRCLVISLNSGRLPSSPRALPGSLPLALRLFLSYSPSHSFPLPGSPPLALLISLSYSPSPWLSPSLSLFLYLFLSRFPSLRLSPSRSPSLFLLLPLSLFSSLPHPHLHPFYDLSFSSTGYNVEAFQS